jgi:hypothetical protein
MLSAIAENLLKDQENEKFRKFKPTNSLIKKNLVEVKGAVEYAVAVSSIPRNLSPSMIHINNKYRI